MVSYPDFPDGWPLFCTLAEGVTHTGKSQQRKGRGGELEIVKVFQAHGINAQPGNPVSFGTVPDVIGIPGIHPEVKRVERLNIPAAMAQAVRDSEKFGDGVPCLFHRRNRQSWLCTMRLEDWLKLYKRAGMAENGPRKG